MIFVPWQFSLELTLLRLQPGDVNFLFTLHVVLLIVELRINLDMS